VSFQNGLFILAEGDDDERFLQVVAKPLLEEHGFWTNVVKYRERTASYVRRLLRSVNAMGADYVLLADINRCPCKTVKKDLVRRKLRSVDERRIIVVAQEIEGWYLAGLDIATCRKLRISHLERTDHVTKEMFDNMVPRVFESRAAFMVEILKNFQISVAIHKNETLRYFVDRYLSQVPRPN